jgi:very-short-patch-repair endonuclease
MFTKMISYVSGVDLHKDLERMTNLWDELVDSKNQRGHHIDQIVKLVRGMASKAPVNIRIKSWNYLLISFSGREQLIRNYKRKSPKIGELGLYGFVIDHDSSPKEVARLFRWLWGIKISEPGHYGGSTGGADFKAARAPYPANALVCQQPGSTNIKIKSAKDLWQVIAHAKIPDEIFALCREYQGLVNFSVAAKTLHLLSGKSFCQKAMSYTADIDILIQKVIEKQEGYITKELLLIYIAIAKLRPEPHEIRKALFRILIEPEHLYELTTKEIGVIMRYYPFSKILTAAEQAAFVVVIKELLKRLNEDNISCIKKYSYTIQDLSIIVKSLCLARLFDHELFFLIAKKIMKWGHLPIGLQGKVVARIFDSYSQAFPHEQFTRELFSFLSMTRQMNDALKTCSFEDLVDILSALIEVHSDDYKFIKDVLEEVFRKYPVANDLDQESSRQDSRTRLLVCLAQLKSNNSVIFKKIFDDQKNRYATATGIINNLWAFVLAQIFDEDIIFNLLKLLNDKQFVFSEPQFNKLYTIRLAVNKLMGRADFKYAPYIDEQINTLIRIRSEQRPVSSRTHLLVSNILRELSVPHELEKFVEFYFIDNADTERMIGIEVDGETSHGQATDVLRDNILAALGWKMVYIEDKVLYQFDTYEEKKAYVKSKIKKYYPNLKEGRSLSTINV